jgi:hypothetical protein
MTSISRPARLAFVAILVGRIIFAAVFVHWPAG